jgi:hypothetical protein
VVATAIDTAGCGGQCGGSGVRVRCRSRCRRFRAAGYQLRTVDVSSFAGQTVTLTFTGTEDASLQTSFVVDDTAVTAS